MLTGRPPFVAEEGPDHQRTLIQAHIDQAPVAPSRLRPELELPSWVDDVVGWALAKDRKDRYHDASTFARMFRSGLEGEIVPRSGLTSIVRRAPERSVGPTGRFVRTAVAAPADEIESLAESRPSTFRRAYNAGGRMARRSRRLKRLMWRMAMILAIGNLLLGMILVARDGPSALVERFLSIAPGTETSVSVDELNLRSAPGVDSNVLVVLPEGTTVRVTGLSQLADSERWWPIEAEYEGEVFEGWAWDGGLQPNAWTGRMSWMQGVVERVNSVRRGVNDTFDDLAGLWPFWIVMPDH
jgi:hypothetical protein